MTEATRPSTRTVVDSGVMHIVIDRPEAKNAIDEEVVRGVVRALARAARDTDVRVVLFRTEGDVFLSGGDIIALSQLPLTVGGAQSVMQMGVSLSAFETCPVPVVAAVQGPVYGGGCELLVMMDIVVMDADAEVRFVHKKMGLVPAWGGATRLVERVGAARAADILFTSRAVGAAEAVQIGLASRSVASGTAWVEAEKIAGELATSPRDVLVAMKRSIAAARGAARVQAFEAEQKVFRDVWGGTAHQEAMARFIARR